MLKITTFENLIISSFLLTNLKICLRLPAYACSMYVHKLPHGYIDFTFTQVPNGFSEVEKYSAGIPLSDLPSPWEKGVAKRLASGIKPKSYLSHYTTVTPRNHIKTFLYLNHNKLSTSKFKFVVSPLPYANRINYKLHVSSQIKSK